MKLNAIVVAYESDDLIVPCVQAALKSGITKIIVWDNDPKGTVQQKLQSLRRPEVLYYTDGINHGFGGAINRATLKADQDASYILINPDCYVTEIAISTLLREASHSDVGVMAPRMHYLDNKAGISGGPYPSLLKEAASIYNLDRFFPSSIRRWALANLGAHGDGSYQSSMDYGPPIELDWVSGFCMYLNRAAFEAVGGFDERYFLYLEDVDICRRISQAGYKVKLMRQLSVLHLESTSTGANGKSNHYRRAARIYFETHGSKFQQLMMRIGVFA